MKSLFATICAGSLLICANQLHAADPPKEPTKDARSTEERLHDAQKRLEQAANEIAELSGAVAVKNMHRSPDTMMLMGRNPNRAALGIVIGTEDRNQNDNGVAVLSVSPGGPAANAGMKAGDVLVELNGKSLKRDKDNSPHAKLFDELGKLSPGDDANVRYLRDGKQAVVKLKVDTLPRDEMRRMRVEIPDMDHLRENMRGFEEFRAFGGFRGPLGDMELVRLTPKLGQYFGTDKGLLIVRAPEDKEIKLEDGDVLLDIDGRAPNDPGHALRILRSYEPGEKVTVNVMRQRKKVAIAVTVPKREEHGRPFGVPVPPPGAPAPPPPAPTGA